MPNPKQTATAGPLKLPLPPDVSLRVAVQAQLRGHTTSATWLPEGLWPELDEMRAEQLRLRGQVAAELDALDALATRFRKEDAEHAERLREAHREGDPASIEDRRTPAEQRLEQRAAIEERLWSGMAVFTEVAEKVIATMREHEDDWLADLRRQLGSAAEKQRQAELLLAEARAEAWTIHRRGQWVQQTADDEAFGRQPAPTIAAPPARFQLPPDTLERPWHKLRPWNRSRSKGA